MDLPVRMTYNEDSAIAIAFPNNVTEDILLTLAEGNHYRAESSCFLGEPQVFYGDVIEIRPTGEKSGEFLRVVRRSGLRVICRTIGKNVTDSALLPALLDKIMRAGGNWERAFGGVLLVHLPESAELDIDSELQSIAKAG